ncbi:MAG: hypothetical protein AB7E70_20900 [Hyphomicrobiaceae bacterium]
MAQHEPVIQDQAVYPDGLTDINDSFAAFLSLHSGTSAPSYAVAGTMWIDTDTPGSGVWTIYMYDGTDHIDMGRIDTVNNRFVGNNHVRYDVAGTFAVAVNLRAFADVASAATVDLGAQARNFLRITGTTTIASFGTANSGVWRILRFADALTLTHNATSLILPGGANITTAENDCALMLSLGSGNWFCAMYQRASGQALVAPASSGSQFAVLEDQKSDGTNGGTATSGSWQTAALNTEVADPDGIVSISSNQFTLAAGDYMIRAWKMFRNTADVRLRIQNITDTATALLGSSQSVPATNTPAVVAGHVSIAGSKAFELQYQVRASASTTGLGGHDNMTLGVEVYAQVEIEKLS